MGSLVNAHAAEQIEPATPPAALQREDVASGPAAANESTFAWDSYPKVISCKLTARSKGSLARHSCLVKATFS